jgi:acetoin utilization protein AcuB
MLVSDYMSHAPVTISKNADYDDAFEIMENQHLHHLPVVNKKGQVVGIVTRRDLQLAARYFHEAPAEVADVMHKPVVSISASASLSTAAKRMSQYGIGGLPVLNRKKEVIGMLTETDLFKALNDLLATKKKPRSTKTRGKK